jgi:hypothetical protein
MVDPINIIWFILHAATSVSLADVGGNFYYDLLKKGGRRATEYLVKRMKAEDAAGRPTNQHLQRALRKAQLKATLLALQSRWEELRVRDPSFVGRVLQPLKDRLFHTEEEAQVVKIRKWLLESLHDVDRATYAPLQQQDYEKIITLADPVKPAPTQAEMDQFAKILKEKVIRELELWHPAMPALSHKIIYGWEQFGGKSGSILGNEVVTFDWFKLVYEYFGEEYKSEGEVTLALNRLIFYRVKDEIVGLPERLLTQYLDGIGGNLLEYFQRNQKQQDEILREVRRQPAYVRWQGRNEAEKVEECLLESSQLLVGRDRELNALDQFVANNTAGSGYYLVKAGAGFGKTSLLAGWVKQRRFEGRFIAYHFFSQRHNTVDVKLGLRNLLRQLYVYYEISKEQLPPDEYLLDTIHKLIEDEKVRPDQPLILVLDALDEANESFRPPFPGSLPLGVFIIISVRAEEGDTAAPYLNNWPEIDAENVSVLGGLDPGAIKQWLERERLNQQMKITLQQMSDDSELAVRLHEKTGGFALYLSYVIPKLVENIKLITDESEQRVEALKIVEQTSSGFNQYLENQYRRLAGNITDGTLRQSIGTLFRYLSAALGALGEYDIRQLTGLKREMIDHLLFQQQARRWFRWREGEFGRPEFFFDHPLIQKEFAERIFEDDLAEVKDRLLAYCRDWQTHFEKSRYALRYFAEHLLLTRSYDELFVLAGNEEFLTTQTKAFPKEPSVSLRTLQTALKGAMENDDAGVLAELSIRHAERVIVIEAESPLDALNSSGLERALSLAELRFVKDSQRGTLWYLFLAWKLKQQHRERDARQILLDLSGRETPRLTNEALVDFAVIALTSLWDVDCESLLILQHRLFGEDDKHRSQLLRSLTLEVGVTSSIETHKLLQETTSRLANEVRNRSVLVGVLTDLAKAQAASGARAEATQTLNRATEALEPKFLCGNRPFHMRDIAQAQADNGEFEAAMQTAQKIEYPDIGAIALAEIAEKLAADGNLEVATKFLSAAMQTVEQNEDLTDRTLGLIAIAKAQAVSGDVTSAKQTARQIQAPKDKAEALATIVQAQVVSGDKGGVDLAQEIEDAHWSGVALAEIAQAQARRGDLNTAAQTTMAINDKESAARALAEIARIQARRGNIAAAMDTTRQIQSLEFYHKALSAVAAAQAENEGIEAALQTVQEFDDPKAKTLAVAHILRAAANNGNVQAAIALSHEIKDDWRRSAELASVAKARAEGKHVKDVEAYFRAVMQADKPKFDGELDQTKWLSLGLAQACCGDVEGALRTAELIKNEGNQALVLILAATSQPDRSTVESLLEAFEEQTNYLPTMTEKVFGQEWKWVTQFTHVAPPQTEGDDVETIKQTLIKAIEAVPQIRDEENRAIALVIIVKAQAASGNWTWAIETSRQIGNRWHRGEALAHVAGVQAQSGAAEAALAMAQEIENEHWRAWALTAIALVQVNRGRLDMAMDIVDNIHEYDNRADVFTAIAQAKAKSGDFNTSRQYFSAALAIAQQIDHDGSRTQVLSHIAQAQAANGDVEGAWRVSQNIWLERNKHLPSIAGVFARVDDKEGFKRFVIPSAYFIDATYRMVGLIVLLYRTQLAQIKKIATVLHRE